MDIDDALALLGLEPDAGDETIRRAYLRRIKKVRPDRDPEGFKALRAAHDLLRDWVSWRDETFERPADSVEGPDGTAESPGSETQALGGPATPDVEPSFPVEASPDATDGSGDAFESLDVSESLDAPESLDASESLDAPESHGAVDDSPHVIDASQPDASPAPGSGPADAPPAPDALGFDLDTLTPDPIAAPIESPWPALHRATQCVEAEDFAAAHRALEHAVEAAEQSYETVGTATFCALVGQMIRSGASPETAALVARWMAVARTSGELLRMPTDGAAMVLLVSELAAVWPEAPADTARVIADAIAEGDLDRAIPALKAYADAYPWGALQFAEVLESRAPNLHAVYASALELKGSAPVSPPSRGSDIPWWVWALGFMMLVRVVGSCDREAKRSRPIVEPARLERLAPPPPPPVLLDMPPELSIPPPAPAPRGPRLIEDDPSEANREALREVEELLRELQRQTREDPTR